MRLRHVTIAIFIFSLHVPARVVAQSVTIYGSAKDKISLLPIDSASIDLINKNNPAEHFSVVTNAQGSWSYTFQSSGVPDAATVPSVFSLEQNYPNPFNPSTKIVFSLRYSGMVRLSVHNILGQKVDEKFFELTPGDYSIEWQSKGSAGVYFYSLEANGTRITRKMVQLDGGSSGGGLGNLASSHRVADFPTLSKSATTEFNIIASKLGYETDTIGLVLADNARADFLLETVHSRALVIDLHNDILEKMVDGYQIGIRHTTDHSDLPRLHEGGIDAQMFADWVDPGVPDSAYYQRSTAMIDTFNAQVARNAAAIAQARTSDDVTRIISEGKLAGILAIEGGHAIENDVEKLKAYYAKGVRYLTITWNNSTAWATSAQDPQSATKGLSEFGKQVIRTMDSLGMIIDVAHTGIKTIQDILAITKNPIIDSHAGVYALRNHYRNLTDDQIRSIAQSGGVVGVVFYTSFLSTASASKVTIDTVIKHIDYIKNLVGIDYVAIGSDFDGGITPPVGLADVSKLPALTLALLKHGYSPADIRKILGENYLRVFKQVCH